MDFFHRHPPWVTLEISNDCNCRCIMCTVRQKDNLTPGMMDVNTVKKFLAGLRNDQFHTAGVRLFWLGEPTMHPAFREILSLFCATDLRRDELVPRIGFDTNGFGLSGCAETLAELAIEMPVHIILSLDAATTRTHARIRPGGDFDRAVSGLESLLDARIRLGTLFPRIAIQFIVMEENASELPDFLDKFTAIFEARSIRPTTLLNASFATADGFNLRPMTWQGEGAPGRQQELHELYLKTLTAAGISSSNGGKS